MASRFNSLRKWLRSTISLSTKPTNGAGPSFRAAFGPARPYATEMKARSPFDANIIRIIRTEIHYQTEYAPPDSPQESFNFFSVEDRPGEQFIRLRRKFAEKEDIKIEATMFDGCISDPKGGGDTDGQDIRLHISLLVEIYKGEGSDALGFVCSAWPDGLEIMKVYILRGNQMLPRAQLGRNLRNINPNLQRSLHKYLEARGVDDELSVFLHQFMVNKDRAELLRWLETVKSFVEQ